MLIQINTNILVMVLDLIDVQNFHLRMKAWEKMSLVLVWCELISAYCNKTKDILFLGFGSTQRSDNTNWTAEAQYSINFSKSNRKCCLNLHFIKSNSFLFVNAAKIYQFKARDCKRKKIFFGFRKYFLRSFR